MNGTKLLDNIKPSDLKKSQMQFYGIANKEFGIEYKLSSKERSNQTIALYALSGKFQIYYVLDSFEAIKMNEKEIAIYPTQIKAYVDDSFDFRNSPNQTIGAWDYEKVGFDLYNSIMQYRNTKFHFKYTSPKSFLFPLYNSDFLKTKQYFNLGLDFFLYSSTFLDIVLEE
ncbi:DUF6402 family protein [Campylobacter sp. W0014]|uniref:DUF6402 family protein n=1 Tax=Campylobacter sp. W0014 TaxID=2735781 RepID=UPI00301DC7B9